MKADLRARAVAPHNAIVLSAGIVIISYLAPYSVLPSHDVNRLLGVSAASENPGIRIFSNTCANNMLDLEVLALVDCFTSV